MKKILLSGLALAAMAGVASATLLTDSWSGTEDVPDGSPVGIANSLAVSDPGGAIIEDISVTLNISGGYNGDLYGYLVFQPTVGSSSMEVLLNQIGTGPSSPFGSPGSGMDVTLSDSGTVNGSIHDATGEPAGVWQPDSANSLDGTFAGQSADGTWTLFLADLSVGGGTSTLTSWGLGVSVVPEPITLALVIFAVLAAALRLIYWLELKARVSKKPKNIERGFMNISRRTNISGID